MSSIPARWELLTKIQRLCRFGLAAGERGKAVCACGYPAPDVVEVDFNLRPGRNDGVRAGVDKIRRCKSPWLCTTCSPVLAQTRKGRVQTATDAAFARGGAVALVVLTASHGLDTPLADIKSLVSTASSDSRSGRAWERLAESTGLAGVIVGQETTTSRANGWHYHQHLAAIVDGKESAEALASVADLDAGTAATAHPIGFIGPLRPDEVFEQARAQRLAEAIRLAVGRGKRRFGPPTRAAVRARLPGALDPVVSEREQARHDLKIGSAALPSPRRIGPTTEVEAVAVRVMRACRAAVGDGMGPPTRETVETELVRVSARARALRIGREIADRYKAAVRAAGGRVSDTQGVFVRLADDTDDAAGYTSKGSMAWEVSGGHKDETRSEESMMPWDLAAAAYDGDAWARHRWAEYVATMPGTRSCVISASLAAALGIAPAEDKPPADDAFATPEGRVGGLQPRVWKSLMRTGLAATFLSRLETGAAALLSTPEAKAALEDAADEASSGGLDGMATVRARAVQRAGHAVFPALAAWAVRVTAEDIRLDDERRALALLPERERYVLDVGADRVRPMTGGEVATALAGIRAGVDAMGDLRREPDPAPVRRTRSPERRASEAAHVADVYRVAAEAHRLSGALGTARAVAQAAAASGMSRAEIGAAVADLARSPALAVMAPHVARMTLAEAA